MVTFKENYHFPRFQVGSKFFQGGGGGGGGGGLVSDCLFHIETHITCNFLGGSRSHLVVSNGPYLPLNLHLTLICSRESGQAHLRQCNEQKNHMTLYSLK